MSNDNDSRQNPFPAPGIDKKEEDSLIAISWVSYILHLIVAIGAVIPGGQFSILLLIIALVIDLVKRDDARNSWLASHFSWRIRSVFLMGILYLVTMPLFLLFYFPGALAWLIISIWFLYRIVLGARRMNLHQAMEPVDAL